MAPNLLYFAQTPYQIWPLGRTTGVRDPRIRALCAQIALELDPKKVDALISDLKRILTLPADSTPIPIDQPAADQSSADEPLDQDVVRKTGTE
jgi:hypothetical protein